jgi:hypothetical protein
VPTRFRFTAILFLFLFCPISWHFLGARTTAVISLPLAILLGLFVREKDVNGKID